MDSGEIYDECHRLGERAMFVGSCASHENCLAFPNTMSAWQISLEMSYFVLRISIQSVATLSRALFGPRSFRGSCFRTGISSNSVRTA